MARTTNGTSDFINCGVPTLLDNVQHASIGGWGYRPSTGTTMGFGVEGIFGSDGYRVGLIHYSDDLIYISVENGAGAVASAISATSGWHHYLLMFDGTVSGWNTAAVLYFDGVVKTLTPASGSPPSNLPTGSNLGNFTFGNDVQLGSRRFWAGGYAEAGVWTASLTQDDATSLAAAVHPRSVRPDKLAYYWGIIGQTSPEVELRAALNGSLTGTSAADHPRVLSPALPRMPARRVASSGAAAPFVQGWEGSSPIGFSRTLRIA